MGVVVRRSCSLQGELYYHLVQLRQRSDHILAPGSCSASSGASRATQADTGSDRMEVRVAVEQVPDLGNSIGWE